MATPAGKYSSQLTIINYFRDKKVFTIETVMRF